MRSDHISICDSVFFCSPPLVEESSCERALNNFFFNREQKEIGVCVSHARTESAHRIYEPQ